MLGGLVNWVPNWELLVAGMNAENTTELNKF